MQGKYYSPAQVKEMTGKAMRGAGYQFCKLCGMVGGQKVRNGTTGERTAITLHNAQDGGKVCQLCDPQGG